MKKMVNEGNGGMGNGRKTQVVLNNLQARGCPKLEWKQINRDFIMTKPYTLNAKLNDKLNLNLNAN